MMTRIKICGITNKKDALEAVRLGADMLGFVFHKKSKRCADEAVVKDIVNELSPAVSAVGVFVNEDREAVLGAAREAGLGALQFHGDETPGYCASFKDGYTVIKAFRVRTKDDLKKVNDYEADYVLLDTFDPASAGGTGKTFDWKILVDFEFLRPVILSGGLDPGNVGQAIKEVAPFGVDVSSGVEESPGKKDFALMKRFVEKVRKLDR